MTVSFSRHCSQLLKQKPLYMWMDPSSKLQHIFSSATPTHQPTDKVWHLSSMRAQRLKEFFHLKWCE